MVKTEGGEVRPGGQALADGVLMRTKLAWAIARADGSVESGAMPTNPFSRVPALRVIAGLGAGLKLGVGRGLIRGRRDAGNRRFLIVLAVVEIGAIGLLFASGPLAGRFAAPVQAVISISAAALSLSLLRKAAPASLWRYHGAEHKAAAAFEAGADSAEVEAAMAMSRLHPRCGTNLLVPLAAMGFALSALPAVIQLFAGALALGLVAEALSLAAKHRSAAWSRILLAPGLFLQKKVTTDEPTPEEQAVACRAMTACLQLHQQLALEPSPAPTSPVVAPLATSSAA
jgi:uncharacterized protein YqhQ